MSSFRAPFAFGAALGGLLWFPATGWAQSRRAYEPATAVSPPELPGALADLPPGATVVTYQSDELTIKARNAPLIGVLREVCNQTGAVLDFPSGADEGIVASLGPGGVSEVLGSLLNDLRFNYAMAGSADDPNALARLIVFPKTKASHRENQVPQPRVSSTGAVFIAEQQAAAALLAGVLGDIQRRDGNALDAGTVGSGANSPQVAQQAVAAGSDAAGADLSEPRPSPIRRSHRRR